MKRIFRFGLAGLMAASLWHCKSKSDESVFTPIPEQKCDSSVYNFDYCQAPFEPRAIGNQNYTFYYSNGEKRIEAYFVQGYPSGTVKIYFPTGKLRFEGTYAHRKATGYWKTYFENGFVKEEGSYNDCMRTGFWKINFESSGGIKEKGNYENGKRVGNWQIYNSDGDIENTINYNC